MTRKKQHHNPISNSYVETDGKRYRVCRYHGRIILIGLKCARGGERLLAFDSRRWKQIERLAR